ncbi:uncharacterized protein STEHIDRAFT_21159, partial [Stereum hirsutum FP-91666 SS1]|uniref:uncharacterized protein n=1 Tax=Stereum hirsutum (strain FP-91666) TaxID=721885 RepID=UPI000440B4B0
RIRTTTMLDIARWAVKTLTGHLPTDRKLWKTCHHKDFSKSFRSFLWRLFHGGYKCGVYWETIPNYELRGRCPVCDNETESLEHILLECTAPGGEIVWNLARQLWEMTGHPWPALSFGTILGCGLSDFRNPDGVRLPGTNRLYRILISESAHLIWKMRCTRRIEHLDDPAKFPSEREIRNKWVYHMNRRLLIDRLTCDKKRYGRRATQPKTVLNTWSSVLLGKENLPDDWIRESGVL